MSSEPATIILSQSDFQQWQQGRRGQLLAGAQRLAIDTNRPQWRILGPDGRIVDEGMVTRACQR